MAGLLVSYKIPVSSMMKKILVKMTGTPTYTIKTSDVTGRLILGQMIIKRETQELCKHVGPEVFEVIIPKSYWRDYRIKRFSESHASGFLDYHFDLFISNLFAFVDSRLILRVEGYTQLRLNIKGAIVEYCESYGITEDEIKVETLVKRYFRERKQGGDTVIQYVRQKSRTLSVSK